MLRLVLLVLVLGVMSVVVRTWLMRQDIAGRAIVSLGLLSIAIYTFGYALYGACHGEVDFVANPVACTRPHPIPFYPQAYRIGRQR